MYELGSRKVLASPPPFLTVGFAGLCHTLRIRLWENNFRRIIELSTLVHPKNGRGHDRQGVVLHEALTISLRARARLITLSAHYVPDRLEQYCLTLQWSSQIYDHVCSMLGEEQQAKRNLSKLTNLALDQNQLALRSIRAWLFCTLLRYSFCPNFGVF